MVRITKDENNNELEVNRVFCETLVFATEANLWSSLVGQEEHNQDNNECRPS